MPTTSPTGWKLIFSDNFATNVAPGSWPGSAYSSTWTAYEPPDLDSMQNATYETSNISVQNGCLILHLSTVAGVTQVAAPVPILPGEPAWQGQIYGMYSVCFRADPGLAGYKTAWLLWPDSDIWAQGEIDFPEGDLTGNMWAFDHTIGNPSVNAFWADTNTGYTSWHVATIMWTASGVTYLLDGKEIGTSTTSPSVPMRWVLQTETSTDGTGRPAPSEAGNVYIDWVAIYAPTS
jgi:hypothetical protein